MRASWPLVRVLDAIGKCPRNAVVMAGAVEKLRPPKLLVPSSTNPGGLRKELADERGVPAYIIFGDTTVRAMAHHYPCTLAEMEGIPGMGEKKRAEFGAVFAEAIAEFLQSNTRVEFA